jgi:hypothetical protein
MPNIRSIDMRLLDDVFEMGNGYVLDFKDRTFSEFFALELNIDIDDPCYAEQGTSKAKRLRCFLNKVDASTAAKTVKALWDYREAIRQHNNRDEWIANAQGRILSLVARIEGKTADVKDLAPAKFAFDRPKLLALKQRLLDLSNLDAQSRGYAFEEWLRDLFNTYRLNAREPFRLRGEQIDGSFVLSGETYLLEAKWQSAPIGVADLHTFEGKLGQKAAWTRGLFVSNSGFTEVGLTAFGRGKRVICMDGLDLFETLNREIPLTEVLERKVRRAAETGLPMIRVRELL